MNPLERFAELEEVLRLALRAERATVWTTLPGIIVSYDAAAVTAVIQPALQGVIQSQDGTAAAVNMPLLLDVPVQFPRGGGVTLTFPIKAGDECTVNFSARCIDGWWQSGGVQLPMEPRMHDLSDAFCTVGPQSQVKKISGISTTTAQLRSDDGAAFVELNPTTHKIQITTTGDVGATVGGNLTAAVTGTATVTAAAITLNGQVTINGTLHITDAVTGDSTAVFTGDVTGQGISLKHHLTSGVVPGGLLSGPPV